MTTATTPKCQTCASSRIAVVSGKCTDSCRFAVLFEDFEHEGYAPAVVSDHEKEGTGSDYMEITFCMDCGQMQGEWPRSTPKEEDFS